jgi:hypothetical protein
VKVNFSIVYTINTKILCTTIDGSKLWYCACSLEENSLASDIFLVNVPIQSFFILIFKLSSAQLNQKR